MENAKKLTGGKKVAAIIGISIAAIVALLLAVVLSLHLFTPLVFNEFFGNAKAEYVTPGLYEGLVPQGYCYSSRDLFIQCGYMTDGKSASRIYVTNAKDTSDTYYVELYTADGKPYTGHTGGITTNDKIIWLANDGEEEDNCIWVIPVEEVLGAKNGDKVTLKTKFQPESRAACCFVDGKYLWVGEFNDGEKYVTKESHTFKVSGGTNYALVCAYALDSDSEYGIASTKIEGKDVFTPTLALSVTNLVQGFTRTPDGFAISTSYAVNPSNIYFYDDVTKGDPDASLKINGIDVPVYFLDADALKDTVTTPPMSEEIFIKDGRLFVLYESASMKYIFGNLIRGIHVYSYGLE